MHHLPSPSLFLLLFLASTFLYSYIFLVLTHFLSIGDMESLSKEVLINIVSPLDQQSISSFYATCKRFCSMSTEGYNLWKQAFISYNTKSFSCLQKHDYFTSEITSPAPWYTPNKSFFLLFLFLKEIENSNAKCIEASGSITFPFFVSSDSSTDNFFFFITPNGDIMQFFVYCDSYENSDLWVVLKQVNQRFLFLPLLCLQYQHGAGWYGCTVPAATTTSVSLLGMRDVPDYDFLNGLMTSCAKVANILNSIEVMEGGWKQIVDYQGIVHIEPHQERMGDDQLAEHLFWCNSSMVEEKCSRSYEIKERARVKAYREKLRGPASEEELVIWEKLAYKADRGHKDDTFSQEWNDLFAQVKAFPLKHQEHLVCNVRSDLCRSFLWCCASRGWTQEAAWAITLGADPCAEAGKGSARDIAKRYRHEPVLQLFAAHKGSSSLLSTTIKKMKTAFSSKD